MLKKILLAIALLASVIGAAQASSRDKALGYDPAADPFDQYHDAIAAAAADKKLVLVIAGGDWCYWCHVLNRFVARNEDIRRGLDETFVIVKVYVGEENYNEFFFSQLPEARGAPHFWIISPDRNVLASQSTGDFEQRGRGYDKSEFLAFIDKWKHRGESVQTAQAAERRTLR
jgi:hypothetical protein